MITLSQKSTSNLMSSNSPVPIPLHRYISFRNSLTNKSGNVDLRDRREKSGRLTPVPRKRSAFSTGHLNQVSQRNAYFWNTHYRSVVASSRTDTTYLLFRIPSCWIKITQPLGRRADKHQRPAAISQLGDQANEELQILCSICIHHESRAWPSNLSIIPIHCFSVGKIDHDIFILQNIQKQATIKETDDTCAGRSWVGASRSSSHDYRII